MVNRVDFADIAVEQWRRERPDLDLSAMGPLARFVRLARAGGAAVDAAFERRGLDRGEFDVLATLRRGGAPFARSPSALAGDLLVTRGGISKRIDRLSAGGLVIRDRGDADRRAVTVRLTSEGLELIDRLIVEHCANEVSLLAVLSEIERRQLDRTLRRLLEHVGAT